jgi:hypothetical protein
LWKHGIHDLVMELCCALHNFRVRLGPWQQIDSIGINSNTLEDPFRHRYPGFRPANGDDAVALAA